MMNFNFLHFLAFFVPQKNKNWIVSEETEARKTSSEFTLKTRTDKLCSCDILIAVYYTSRMADIFLGNPHD